jgi:hypothetical protein
MGTSSSRTMQLLARGALLAQLENHIAGRAFAGPRSSLSRGAALVSDGKLAGDLLPGLLEEFIEFACGGAFKFAIWAKAWLQIGHEVGCRAAWRSTRRAIHRQPAVDSMSAAPSILGICRCAKHFDNCVHSAYLAGLRPSFAGKRRTAQGFKRIGAPHSVHDTETPCRHAPSAYSVRESANLPACYRPPELRTGIRRNSGTHI